MNARQTVMKKCDENLGNFGANTERERVASIRIAAFAEIRTTGRDTVRSANPVGPV